MKSGKSKDRKNPFEFFKFYELSEFSSGTDSQVRNDQTLSGLLQACFWPHFGLAST